MQRTGVRSTTAHGSLKNIQAKSCFEIVGIYSHLATADHPNDPFALKQISTFNALLTRSRFSKCAAHPPYRQFGRNSIFPSSPLRYGPGLLDHIWLSPKNCPLLKRSLLVFLSRQKSRILRSSAEGEGISYGHSHVTKSKRASSPSPLATEMGTAALFPTAARF